MANPTPRVTPVQLFLPLDAPEQLLEPVEIYRLDDVALLSRLKEDRRIERKSAGISQRALGDYICMWANTTPFGGLVVVGMEDDGAISGCRSTAMSHLNDLERAGDIHCPDARYESKRLHALNVNGEDDFLLVVIVHYRRDKVARTSRGDAFARRGESKRQLSEDEIRELEIDKGQLDLEQELTTVQYPGGFDREMITAFANAFRVSRGLGPERGVEEILHLRHLGVMEKGVFHPNNACALLFAKDSFLHGPEVA